MKLLNLCCGNVRVQSDEWINVDNLHATLLPGTPERENLDREKNYVNEDVLEHPIPGRPDYYDGILASHCVEHWDCQEAARVMGDCHKVLKPGGVLLVSVPDASYFRKVHDEDTVENAERLFGEPIHLPDGETTFFGYGLWNRWHKAVLTEDALWCYFRRAGFSKAAKVFGSFGGQDSEGSVYAFSWDLQMPREATDEMAKLLNRLPFSLVMCGVKE